MNVFDTEEMSFLLSCCKVAISKDKLSKLNVTTDSLDWSKLQRLATYHRIRPLLYKGLITLDLKEQVPPVIFSQLKSQVQQILFRNMENARELIQLTKKLQQADIEVIPYKGISLSQLAYGDINSRESSDIDLLIKRKDLETIGRILEKDNYQAQFTFPSFLRPLMLRLYSEYNYDSYTSEGVRKFHVEPHLRLGSKMYQTAIEFASIEPLTVQGELLGTPMRLLTPEGLLLTTCIHHGGNSDSWQYLKLVTDIAAILERHGEELQWMDLLQVAQQLKVENIVLIGVGLAQKLFDFSLPDPIQLLIKERNLSSILTNRVLRLNKNKYPHFAISFLQRILYFLKSRKGWMTKSKIIWYHMVHIVLRLFIIERYKTVAVFAGTSKKIVS